MKGLCIINCQREESVSSSAEPWGESLLTVDAISLTKASSDHASLVAERWWHEKLQVIWGVVKCGEKKRDTR